MKNLFAFLSLCLVTTSIFSQEKETDSTKIETLDEVLVKAVRVKATSPITHTNVTKKELAKRNLGQDIPVLLNFLPSVVTTSDAGAGIGYTGIRIRGVSAQSTNITINGIPYSDAESLGTFWVNLGDFASSIESLQLQRGVGTSTNGSAAFGASINILTDAVSKEASGEVSNSFGSFNTRKHTVKFSTGLMNEHFEIAGRLSNIESDGYIDRASTSLKSYFLQGSYVDDNTLIKAITFGGREMTYQSWFGFDPSTIAAIGENPNLEDNRQFNISGIQFDDNGNRTGFYDNQIDDYRQDHYQLHWNERYNRNWSSNIGLNYTNGRGFFEEYIDNYYYSNILFAPDATFDFLGLNPINVNGTSVDSMDYVRQRWLDNNFYVLNANINYKDNTIDAIMGVSLSHYDGDHFGKVIWAEYATDLPLGERYYEGNGKKNDASVFAKADYRLNDKIRLFGDVQVRNVNYETSGLESSGLQPFDVDVNYTFFNPKAGITYKTNSNNSFYFSYARANREPSRQDFENNPNVRPEQLNDFELGWRHNKGNFTFNANGYFMLYNEQLVLSGQLDDVGNPIRTNSGESYRLGVELEAIIPITPQLTLQPNATISVNRNRETITSLDGELVSLGETAIAFSPDVIAANAIVYQPAKNLQVSLLSKFVGEQFMSNTEAELSKLDSFFVNDLNVTYTIKTNSVFDSVVLTGLVNNIFNEKFVSNGYYYTFDDDFSNPGTITTIEGVGFYPQATTNFLLGLTLNF
ncbi:TonB-dependent receptor [Winogradskyella aurantia]|uniref:TonB-dependent receptor n=1 Tax=Winogradskyella aurantia TaxID=1915063 RepID=A0A265UZ95_9FLAO|nr:TonB-dependent receptor [Winogradskyella aurantia]OZV70616.1 TonB-dependent receptor [Winogradskyella aurantia]